MEQIYTMEQIAREKGYTFSHKGCPCNGTPYIYTKETSQGKQELWLYPKRDIWRLQRNHRVVAQGTANDLQKHIQQWD